MTTTAETVSRLIRPQIILNSCAPNAIIYTGGDNDTFPLWYAQSVASAPMCVIVLSYYQTDWYIGKAWTNIMNRSRWNTSLSLNDYKQGGLNDGLRFLLDRGLKAVDWNEYLNLQFWFLKAKRWKKMALNTLPTKIFVLKVIRQPLCWPKV